MSLLTIFPFSLQQRDYSVCNQNILYWKRKKKTTITASQLLILYISFISKCTGKKHLNNIKITIQLSEHEIIAVIV